MNKNELRVKFNDGYLIAGRNPDIHYDGIYIMFETNDGERIDIAVVECPTEDNYKKINVYTYEDVYTEDMTRKYTLDIDEIYDAFN